MKLLAAVLLAALVALAAPSAAVHLSPSIAAVTASSDACGTQPLKPDGTGWQCTFVDNFTGTTLDRTKWLPVTAFVTGSETVYACYRDDPANVNVKNGSLNLRLVRLKAPAPCGVSGRGPSVYQSGMVSTYHRFSQQYGRFEARVKNTSTTQPGLHEAFWMWPDDQYGAVAPWPDSGEIDVAETFSIHAKTVVSALHYSADAAALQPDQNSSNCYARRGVWNTYTLEWSPTRIETFVNGKSCLVNTSGDPAFQKPYILNFTEAIGPEDMGNLPTSRTPNPASYQVDYVRVWQ
jgi:beta-glucanase (GH16 family)